MELGGDEFGDVRELIGRCYNRVSCLGGFMNEGEEPEVK